MQKHYFHLFANGSDAKNFITSEQDFRAAFNRFGVCAANTDVSILSFSIDETHPHSLIYATYDSCLEFKHKYECSTRHYIASTRGSLDNVVFELEMLKVEDDLYLKNVAVYTIIQATKDGKKTMPYDYYWGTGSMYFRTSRSISVWEVDDNGRRCQVSCFSSLSDKEKRSVSSSKSYKTIPDDWLVCNGLILPSNYIDVQSYESIFKTHNCFRAFQASNKTIDSQMIDLMSSAKGVELEDLEARQISNRVCEEIFGQKSATHLTPPQRLKLAGILRGKYHLTIRQVSIMSRLPESEVRKYYR